MIHLEYIFLVYIKVNTRAYPGIPHRRRSKMRIRSIKLLSLLLALLIGLTGCSADSPRNVHKIDWVTSPYYLAEDVPLPVPTGDLVGCCTDGEYVYILADEKVGEEIRSVLSRASLADGKTAVLEDYAPPELPEEASMNRYGPILAPDGTLWLYETWTIFYYDLPADFDETTEIKSKYLSGRDEFHHLRQLDANTGREKRVVDLSEAVLALSGNNTFSFSSFAVDSRENIYFSKTGGVAVLNSRGNLQFVLEADIPRNYTYNAAGGNLILLPDGSAAALAVKPGGMREVRSIDPDAKSWGGLRCELPSTEFLYSGSGGFLFFYTSGSTLYGWPEGGDGAQALLDWSSAGLNGSVMCFAPLDKGRLATLSLQYDPDADPTDWYATGIRLALCSPSDKAPEDGKITLVYGTTHADDSLQARINRFNRQNTQYHIEIRCYSGQDYRLKLSADVMSGRSPDIWDSSLPIELYARKGYLEDLWPWIDGDEELGGRDALMTHVLDCASIDGKLYNVGATFWIHTMVGCASVVGDRIGWTLEEMLEAYRSLPEDSTLLDPVLNYNRFSLSTFLTYGLDRWVDWSTGTCSFDSEDFKSILELCAGMGDQLPEPNAVSFGYPTYKSDADGGEAMRAGRQLLAEAHLTRPKDILYYEAMCGGPEAMTDYKALLNENNIFSHWIDEDGRRDNLICTPLSVEEQARESGKLLGYYPLADNVRFGILKDGGYAAYVGYPTPEGSGSAFEFGLNHCAISASCAHKDGAWAYVRQLLLPGGSGAITVGSTSYTFTGFPVNKADFEAQLWAEPSWFQFKDGTYALDKEGNRIEEVEPSNFLFGVGSPIRMVIYPLTLSEAQAERFMDLYNATSRMTATDPVYTLENLITEQAQPYFAGDKSLDETVDLIQRRVTLYVNENR